MKHLLLAGLAMSLLPSIASARSHFDFFLGFGGVSVGFSDRCVREVVVAPAPCAAPEPCYAPAVVCDPAPVYCSPSVVYYPPTVVYVTPERHWFGGRERFYSHSGHFHRH